MGVDDFRFSKVEKKDFLGVGIGWVLVATATAAAGFVDDASLAVNFGDIIP